MTCHIYQFMTRGGEIIAGQTKRIAVLSCKVKLRDSSMENIFNTFSTLRSIILETQLLYNRAVPSRKIYE